ncbi:MAG: YihY/virulence factor BrkB family protein [Actinomycetota bacterium]|nr:YihY/virulence factor BrkB family protein [Actinomycetota bacterium]
MRRSTLIEKFFADRGPHLAAMIAYFALLSFVPLAFLTLALLGFTGRADESSFVVDEIRRAFPETPIEQIVRLVDAVRRNATTLGLIGGVALLWTALSLFSVLESAFNIVYGRPNRSFLHGKGLAVALMLGSLVTLFVALLAGSVGFEVLRRFAPGFIGNAVVAYGLSVAISTAGIFAFLVSVYYVLTNVRLSIRDVLPGALFATVLLQVSFQILPIYVRFSNLNVALKTFGGPAILLVWLYVMSNVIVFGAEINWWRAHRTARARATDEVPGLA